MLSKKASSKTSAPTAGGEGPAGKPSTRGMTTGAAVAGLCGLAVLCNPEGGEGELNPKTIPPAQLQRCELEFRPVTSEQ